MPIFDYQCLVCDHRFDQLVAHDDPNPACPECGCETFKLVSNPSPPIFHGSGFHETDYKRKPR